MKALIAQLARFSLVGAAATLVHVAVAWLANRAGAAPFAANAAGFATAFACSYLGHFHWTFPGNRGHRTSLPRFLVVSGFGFALTNVIVWAVATGKDARFDLALLVILVVVPPATWALSRLWAFRG